MALLLSLSQQQAIKKISPNWAAATKSTGGVTNYEQLAQEVQDFYLGDFLGNGFAYDVILTPANYVALLDGVTFEDYLGNTVNHLGLRYCIAYWNYANYVQDSMFEDTFTGMVQKNRQETESLSSGNITRLQTNARNIAEKAFNNIKMYLDINSVDYPLWVCAKSRKPYQPNMINVRKTSYGKETVNYNQVNRTYNG